MKRPGRMRWDYEDPERKIALIEGTETRLYLEEDQQLWEGRLDDTEAFLPDLLNQRGHCGRVQQHAGLLNRLSQMLQGGADHTRQRIGFCGLLRANQWDPASGRPAPWRGVPPMLAVPR